MTGLPPHGRERPDGTRGDGAGAGDGPGDGPVGGPGSPGGAGSLRPTSGGVLAAWAAAGLVAGWLLRPLAVEALGAAPSVQWRQVLALVLVAAALGVVARLTRRTLHVHRLRLEPHQAVNRLLLARASAIAGAFVAGGYGGYAVSWLGLGSERATGETGRSLAAAAAGVAVLALALLLERACRVRSDDPEP